MHKNSCYIVDIDGTLANGKHRQHWVRTKPKNWKAYDSIMVKDIPILPVITTIVSLANNFDIVLCSGRKDSNRKETVEWLEKYGIPYSELHMRPATDFSDDCIIKEKMAHDISKRYDIVAVFDDRHKVVNHWRTLGYFVFDCNQERSIF